jgi:hypothetical protein
MPAPASMPNPKTATAAISFRAGVRVINVLSVAQGCSAMGTRQMSPAPTRREARFMPAAISHEGSPRVTEGAFAGPPFRHPSLHTSVGVLALFGPRVRRWSHSERAVALRRIKVFEEAVATLGNHSAPAP